MVTRQLNRFHKEIKVVKSLQFYEDAEVMLSVVVNIALKNPKTYQISMAIISKLISFCDRSKQAEVIISIRSKLNRVPNAGLLDVWLQRISYKIDKRIEYTEDLTKLIGHRSNPGNILWNASWLDDRMKNILDISITNRAILRTMPEIISDTEVELFTTQQHSL